MNALIQVLKIVFSFIKFDTKPSEPPSVPTTKPLSADEQQKAVVFLVPSAEILKQGWSKSLSDCHKNLQDAFPKVQATFLAKHLDLGMRCDYTWRSNEFQHSLFVKGRELQDGKWVIVDPKLVVTQVDAGGSHHNPYLSQALDFIIFKGKTPLWVCKEHPEYFDLYAEVGHLFESYGLISGATWKFRWKDPGHIQVAYEIV